MDNQITVTLSGEEFQRLILLMGYAAGGAAKDGNKPLAYNFMRVANAVNRNNPRWTPYNPPEDNITVEEIITALIQLVQPEAIQ